MTFLKMCLIAVDDAMIAIIYDADDIYEIAVG